MNKIPAPDLSEQRIQYIVWALLCIMPLIGMVVDLVAPSLPAIATSLQVSTAITKNVISIYLFGYAIGNFFTGFLTDALGRQKILRFSMLGFMLVSLIPLFFPQIAMLLLARFLQGLTIGATGVVARAIFSDILTPRKLIHLGTVIGTMWGLGPVIGPLIGGYLQFYIGWQAGFAFFALAGLVLLVVTLLIVPETHFRRKPLQIKTILANLTEVVNHRKFMALVVLMGLMYSLIISFNTAGPFFVQSSLHYSAVFFGHLALVMGLVFLSATFICRYLLKKNSAEQLFFSVITLFFVISIVDLILSYVLPSSILLFSIASALMFFACGFIFPLSMGKGLSLFRHIAGTASATMYLVNVLITSLTAFLVSFIVVKSAIPLMWIYGLLMLMSVLVYWLLLSQNSGQKSS